VTAAHLQIQVSRKTLDKQRNGTAICRKQQYFLSSTLGVLKTNQNTAARGLVWWFGGKKVLVVHRAQLALWL
jgi:hypothetical protein